MQKDLFGDSVETDSKCLRTLKKFDADTMSERVRRCNHLFRIIQEDRLWFSSDESYFIFIEIKMAYITGCFISTVILAQSFIERKFQEDYHFSLYSDPRAKLSLSKILKELRKDKSIDKYWIDRIDEIRKKRNPFVHFRTIIDQSSITLRSNFDREKAIEILENDAKEALEIMYVVAGMKRLG